MRELERFAKSTGLEMVVTEGGGHTKVQIGRRWDMVPGTGRFPR
jgi:hypothetical protein